MQKVPHAWNLNINFIGRMSPILWVSAIVCTASIALVAIKGFNFGTDFAGGYEIQVQFPKSVSETQIRDLLEPIGLDDARVQRFGGDEENAYLILARGESTAVDDSAKQNLKTAFTSLAGGDDKLTTWAFAENAESLKVGFTEPITEEQVRNALTQAHFQVKHVTRGERADKPEYAVDLTGLSDKIAHQLVTGLGLPQDVDIIKRVDFVGPQVGAQLRHEGVMAVVYSLLLILLYVSVRFDMYFSPGAIIATLHDVIIVLGVFSLFEIEFNLTVVAAILTLIGFSLNDTIVVFDRIRENVVRLRGTELHELVNHSINETLSRTVLTSGTVLLVTAALLFLGGPFIRGFSITMFVGVIVGTYSSIAVASPLYILLREHYQPQLQTSRKKPAKQVMSRSGQHA